MCVGAGEGRSGIWRTVVICVWVQVRDGAAYGVQYVICQLKPASVHQHCFSEAQCP